MARSYSHKDWPHRVLNDTGANAQRGDDVKVLRRNTLERLSARDIKRVVGPDDGVFRKELYSAAKTAAHFLGVPDEWTSSKTGVLVREQKVIVYPETRTEAMIEAARARMDNLEKEREEAARRAKRRERSGRLTEAEIIRARRLAVAAMRLAYDHRNVVHYTQGASRWSGIRQRRRSATGQFPFYCDCSSIVTWAGWNALTNVGGMAYPDVFNGLAWGAGYTGTLLNHGIRVSSRLPGDLVLYGGGFPGRHVAMVAENTDFVYSHGSESGPHYLRWNYRGDIMSVRRYIR